MQGDKCLCICTLNYLQFLHPKIQDDYSYLLNFKGTGFSLKLEGIKLLKTGFLKTRLSYSSCPYVSIYTTSGPLVRFVCAVFFSFSLIESCS